ncbi:MAG TPA: M48 family metallopeptidase [Thermomicrobiales bacterium]|jgi:STE24 endopeptidase|nr:M48 family metallopeptidase [Thermomicrobiales bacterium]
MPDSSPFSVAPAAASDHAAPATTNEIDDLIWDSPEVRERARSYHRLRRRLGLGLTAAAVARQVAFVGLGGASGLESALRRNLPHPELVAPAYALVTSAISIALDLPASYLAGHRVERAYELTKQSDADWLRQRLLAYGMGTAFRSAALTGIHHLLRRRPDDWWVIVAAGFIPVSVLTQPIFIRLIMPRFNRFDPLDDEELTNRLRALGERVDVPIADVYVMDMSRQTERANAMFTGMGRNRRIILGDTLTRSFEPAEVEGVIAHELGHQVNRDIWTLTAITAAQLTALVAGVHYATRPVLRRTASTTGIRSTDEVAVLAVMGLLSASVAMTLSPLPAFISRTIERRTDRFALELTGDGETYARAMARLGRGNMVDPDPPRWRERLLSSHPPIVERIRKALAFAGGRA